MQPFDPDAFVQSCIDALGECNPADAVRELVQRAVSEPRSLELACPVPVDLSDDGVIYVSDEIRVRHAIFPRRFQTGIHDHSVEAVIGAFAPVRLAFAWAQSDAVPVILGQTNFFHEFDVLFMRSRGVFEGNGRAEQDRAPR